jgi:hypothetical protein
MNSEKAKSLVRLFENQMRKDEKFIKVEIAKYEYFFHENAICRERFNMGSKSFTRASPFQKGAHKDRQTKRFVFLYFFFLLDNLSSPFPMFLILTPKFVFQKKIINHKTLDKQI